jgi:D-alanyl-D-alanine carboxypeptidase (penicillin-binding protein 5/6)
VLRVRAAIALLAAVLIVGSASGAAAQQGGQQGKQPGAAPQASGGPKLNAKAWILIDARDGTVLASKGPDRELPIASTTKLMTAYLTLKKLKPSQMLTAPAYHPTASAEVLLGLRAGEKMRVRDLLYGLLLPSANDAAQTLAVGVAGNEPAFVAQMNQAAQTLGLTHTSYANPIGLDDPDNYSSARDLVTLADTLRENALFARIVDTPTAVLRSGDHPRRVETRDTLVETEPFVNGVKTGHTLGAGYVLVGSGTQDSTTLISAVLGAPSEPDRDADTLKLLEYGFSQYKTDALVSQGEEVADPKLEYSGDHLPLLAKEALRVKYRQGQVVDTRVEAPDEVSGAVEKGEELGRVVATVDGQTAASAPLLASRSVEAASLFDKAVATAQNPVFLLPLGAIVIVVGLLLSARGRRPETGEAEPPVNGARRTRREPREPRERTPEERRKMHEERMRRRQQRAERGGGR